MDRQELKDKAIKVANRGLEIAGYAVSVVSVALLAGSLHIIGAVLNIEVPSSYQQLMVLATTALPRYIAQAYNKITHLISNKEIIAGIDDKKKNKKTLKQIIITVEHAVIQAGRNILGIVTHPIKTMKGIATILQNTATGIATGIARILKNTAKGIGAIPKIITNMVKKVAAMPKETKIKSLTQLVQVVTVGLVIIGMIFPPASLLTFPVACIIVGVVKLPQAIAGFKEAHNAGKKNAVLLGNNQKKNTRYEKIANIFKGAAAVCSLLSSFPPLLPITMPLSMVLGAFSTALNIKADQKLEQEKARLSLINIARKKAFSVFATSRNFPNKLTLVSVIRSKLSEIVQHAEDGLPNNRKRYQTVEHNHLSQTSARLQEKRATQVEIANENSQKDVPFDMTANPLVHKQNDPKPNSSQLEMALKPVVDQKHNRILEEKDRNAALIKGRPSVVATLNYANRANRVSGLNKSKNMAEDPKNRVRGASESKRP